ncbi:hypothetical protein [Streptomyces sp. FIT100]|uniref:hypothetical protein n=1 Tax=Streptomyces sp. FIT100 TaxID=2837956 RepID=UPI0021C940BA|nr:hypothetical protein [Streptomyces sp. FIT100]UUN25655.1 hypothetical protein KK483_03880 [Streptomyces sp. FIT100]
MNGPVALLTVAVVIAALVVRTAITELREPGSARRQWADAGSPRAIGVGAGSGAALGLIGWQSSGYAALAWAVLAGILVAFIVGGSSGPSRR